MKRSSGSAEQSANDMRTSEHRAALKRPSGSAAQSANDMQPAEYITGTCLAPPVGYGGFYRLAFYDICWNISSSQKHHTMHHLAREICDIIGDKGVDAVGISGVFGLREDHREKRPEQPEPNLMLRTA